MANTMKNNDEIFNYDIYETIAKHCDSPTLRNLASVSRDLCDIASRNMDDHIWKCIQINEEIYDTDQYDVHESYDRDSGDYKVEMDMAYKIWDHRDQEIRSRFDVYKMRVKWLERLDDIRQYNDMFDY